MSFEIVDYTDKAIAVFGDVKKYDSEFLRLDGKYNEKLKYQGGQATGFIFPKFKKPQVQELVRKLKVMETSGSIIETEDRKSDKSTINTSRNNEDNVVLSREQFMNLVSTLNRLEQDVAFLKRQIGLHSITVPAEKETKLPKNTEKVVKQEKKEESSDEDYSNDFCEGDEEMEMPDTKGPSLLKKKSEGKKVPSLLKK
jgi:hypothetical protein